MGAQQTKLEAPEPVMVEGTQLLRIHFGDDMPFIVKSPGDFKIIVFLLTFALRSLKMLIAITRERFDIPPTERIDFSTKLALLGDGETELDPDTWEVLRPKISDIWVNTRPMPTAAAVKQPINDKRSTRPTPLPPPPANRHKAIMDALGLLYEIPPLIRPASVPRNIENPPKRQVQSDNRQTK
ncbi:hypothetical protein FRC17_004697 [Serendipita sp. 399]|nr:hypothetical protein FRC17_004697 [Serendipita sp. 399]